MAKWQPDISSLRMFIAVCEERTISRAAERESIVPSAISKRISEIESMTGTELLIRGGRGVTPTAAGLALLHHARSILQSTNKLQAELGEYAQGVRGHVCIFANVSSLAQYLPRDIARFLAEHPSIRADVEERVSSAVIEGVRDGTADIGVCLRTPELDGLEIHAYSTDRLVLIVHREHPLASRDSVQFDDTLEYDFVGLQPGSRMTGFLAARAATQGRSVNYRMYVSTYDAACKIIAENLAIGVLAYDSVKLLQNALGLRAIALTDSWTQRELIVCIRDHASLQMPARALFDHLKTSGENRLTALAAV